MPRRKNKDKEPSWLDKDVLRLRAVELKELFKKAKTDYRNLEKSHTEIQTRLARWDGDHHRLLELNSRLAEVNVDAADLMAELEEKNESLRDLNQRLAGANAQSAELMAELDEKNNSLIMLNENLSRANAESAELMAELDEKNEALTVTNRELARANAHAAELMAVIELKNEEIQRLNKALSKSNARAASLIANREIQMEKLKNLNMKFSYEIKERKKAEEALQKETAKLSAMISGMEEGVLFVDRRDRVVEVNDYFLELVGKKRSEIYGSSLWVCPIGMSRKVLRQYISGFKNNPHAGPEVVEGPIGEFEILFRLQPIYRNDEYDGLILNLVDVTELVVTRKKAQQASQAKSEFLANMSHEIRTPMNAILGFTEILESSIVDEVQRKYLSNISSSGKALMSLINDILDLSKIEAGKMEISPGPIDIRSQIHEIEQIFSYKIQEKGIEFRTLMNPELPRVMILDKVRLRQILLNLVGNAVKFTSRGFVQISIDCANADADGTVVDLIISVRDTGIGIPSDQQEVIFESFGQMAGQDATKYGGTGLGLAITKRLVQMMNGSISVKSTVGEGSTFFVRLADVEVASGVTTEETRHRNIAASVIFDEAVILIVDDVPTNRDLIKAYLESTALTVLEAGNGAEAIEIMRQSKPDLVLMDVKMPKMGGLEAVNIIKNDTNLAAVPMICLSASAMKEEEEEIKKVFDGYLTKPVSRDALLNTLRRYMAHTADENGGEVSIRVGKNDREPITAPEDLDPEAFSNLPALLELLEGTLMEQWKIVKKQFILKEVQEFGSRIEELGGEYGIDYLTGWGEELVGQAKSFDLDNLPRTLDRYPAIVKDLKSLLNR